MIIGVDSISNTGAGGPSLLNSLEIVLIIWP